jgi:zinc protease
MHDTRRHPPLRRFTPTSLIARAALKRRLVVAAGLLVSLVIASAAAPPACSAETIRQETLPNGMRVILVENHSRPLIGACIFVNGGSRTETPALSGLSHYYEHLIFRGGSTRQAELEFRKEMQRLGEESGGYTTNDYTCFGFTAPVNHFDEALWRSCDAWMNLRLTQEKVAKERQVVMEEYNQGQDRPDYQVYYQIEHLMFHDHPYKRDTIGLKEVIQGASLATFRTFYDERYVPNQIALAVVGDFDADAMAAKIAKAFGSYRRGRGSFEQGIPEKPQAEFRMGVQRMKTPSTQFYLGFHVPPYADPDAPALTVLASLLGKGSSSRLYRALKEHENVVTSVDADFEVRKDPGMFLISAELPPANEAKAFGIIRDELRRLATEPVPAAELARVKSALLNRYDFDGQRMFRRAERLCLFATMSDVSLEPEWPRLLQSVKPEDIQRLARSTFAPTQSSYSVVRPEGTDGPSEGAIRSLVAAWTASWPGGAAAAATASTSVARREALPNGITLILKEDHASPIVAAFAMARGGQWIEPDGLGGVSNMATRLLRRGAGSRSAREISDRAEALGMILSADGSADYASVAFQAPSRNFGDAWGLYCDVLMRPTFPSTEVAKIREDLMQHAKSIGDRPFDYTNLRFAESLYTDSPYRRAVEGDTISLARIQVPDLKRAYQRMFCGANLVITVVGDFDATSFLATARKTLASVPKGVPVEVGGVREREPEAKRVAFMKKDQEQVTYNTGWLGCSVRDADYVPLRVLTSLIGDKVFFKYVYEKGVAYRSWFYMLDRLGQASVQNEMGVTPANFPMASSGVLDDVAGIVGGPITATQLQGTVEKLLSRYMLNVQENAALAQRLCFDEAAGLGFEYADRYPELVRKVTLDQVKEVARKYLPADRYTRVAVGREPAAAKPQAR